MSHNIPVPHADADGVSKSAQPAAKSLTQTQVAILAGGLSHERDVSLRSGRRVAEALRSAGMDVSTHDIDANLLPFLKDQQPDIVWPLLHGDSGEDGSISDVLELIGIPYVGSRPRASRIAWDKTIAKSILARSGIHTPEYVALPQSLFRELGAHAILDSVVAKLGLPLVVKPSQGGSALGVSIVTKAEDLPRAMVYCFAYGQVALIEQRIVGTELAISVVEGPDGVRTLPPVEIVTDGDYDYDARYNPGRTEYFTPARITADDAERVAAVALTAHRELSLRHVSRTDVVLDADGQIHFLEVNVSPGVTETSLLPQAAVAAGLDLPTLYRSIVEAALSPRN